MALLQVKKSRSISLIVSVGLHLFLGWLLFFSFEKTIVIPAQMPNSPTEMPIVDSQKEIIEANIITDEALKKEVARLDAVEAKQKAREAERQRALMLKEKEAKEKRIQEEKLAQTLALKNAQLKKEAEEKRLAQIAQEKEHQQKLQAQIKAEQEILKKIEKEKQAAIAAKQKAEEERKQAELAKQKAAKLAAEQQAKEKAQAEKARAEEAAQQALSARAKQDQINHYAILMQNKIHRNWRQPIGIDFGGLKCIVAVRLLPTGEVIEARVVKSSGNVEFDRSAELAIHKASPLPMPTEVAVIKEFRQFDFTFNPGVV